MKKRIQYLGYGVLLLLILSIGWSVLFDERSALLYVKESIIPNTDTVLNRKIYQDLTKEYQVLNKRYGDAEVVVFLGDSIAKRFNLDEISNVKNLIILNRGIFYDTTFGLLKRLDSTINNLNIKALFIMIGHNDLKSRDNDKILKNISDILSSVNAGQVFIHSLLPVDSRWKETNQRIRLLNEGIKNIAKDKGVKYIDLYSNFSNSSGGMDYKYSSDGVHPNILGYQLWYSVIEPILFGLDELMTEKLKKN